METRLGTQTTYFQQLIHGTRYIDELVMIRVKDRGDLYVHQDANWNVVALTDLGGHVVERYVYSPYGEVTVYQETGFGDWNGDGLVDQEDRDAMITNPPQYGICSGGSGGACRILDLDFDGDQDGDDETLFDALPQGLARHPGLKYSGVHQPFGHQGLLFEPEIGQYQNRARQYHPAARRFAQRDPLALRPRAGSGYQDGLSLYAYLQNNPLGGVDPAGSCTVGPGCEDGSEGPGPACDFYITEPPSPWHLDYTICRYLSPVGPWGNCVRCCLQMCYCDYPACGRWYPDVKERCHAGCFLHCAID